MRLLIGIAIGAGVLTAQSPPQKIWGGVYTPEQAVRGKDLFVKWCSNCHNADLNGNDRGPSLRGERFLGNWLDGSLGSLYSKIRFSMPATYPDMVPDAEKLDILTYVLEMNGFPDGPDELELNQEVLDAIPIVRQGQTGIANFALVRLVGCLEAGPKGTWRLANSSEPEVTNADQPNAAELQAAAGKPLGTETYRLVSVGGFAPESHRGKRVEARGLYYTQPGDNRLNVTALAAVGDGCGAR